MEQWPTSSSQNILVVDDDPQVCDILTEALTRLGYAVHSARDGVEALERIEEGTVFDIVLTDIDMPRMDGMELIRHLVKHHSGIDIIAITGITMRYRYTDVVSEGAADFITKPFSLNELEAKLSRLLRERYLRHELERLAVRDHLTGLYNRRFFQRVVRKEATRAVRYKHPLFLFFFDIDRFKEYNDQKGHQAGDRLLIQFAGVLTSSIRENVDTAFRFGGDEFTMLLPYLPSSQALMVAERIRKNYNLLGLKPTTLSIGIAQFHFKTGEIDADVEDMIHRSDKALYHVKQYLGGNRAYFDEEFPSGPASATPTVP